MQFIVESVGLTTDWTETFITFVVKMNGVGMTWRLILGPQCF